MTKSGKLISYWSYVSNVTRKCVGTSEEAKAARKAVRKLTKIRLPTFPTQKHTRKAIKKWKKILKEKAKEYQTEVKKAKKDGRYIGKIPTLKEAQNLMPAFNVDGTPSEDFPSGES